jgi:hypothetical protein
MVAAMKALATSSRLVSPDFFSTAMHVVLHRAEADGQVGRDVLVAAASGQ